MKKGLYSNESGGSIHCIYEEGCYANYLMLFNVSNDGIMENTDIISLD
jgi:hypothetical protein